ncbi:hypothetical protein NDU88_000448 [Pleurodeles waltl]|uniref:Protein phosphatase inhibitor 2 n=1 Tax=Pleurodeles waltl TaxID=8319 RepID=A0AAV7KNE6_PLEWA|nr:hypothetical protein NDU88_000448 [Pleurodeles waltl]
MTPGPTPRGSIAVTRKPTRGILKITSTQAVPLPPEMSGSRRKSQRWDEMNILATYHPPGKDYGLIKVDEPKTPFNRILDDGTEEDRATGGTFLNPVSLTPELLAERLAALDGISPKALKAVEGRSRTGVQESPDREEFLSKRKAHYNEGRYLGHSVTDDSQRTSVVTSQGIYRRKRKKVN